MSDEARHAITILNRLAEELRCRAPLTTKRLDYYKGNHKLCYASDEFQRYFAGRYTEFSDNWTAPVAAAPAERMNVQGIRLDEDLREGDKELSRAWREADCERGSSEAFVTTMAAARSYCLVWADPEDDDVPCVTWERPDQAVIGYDSDTRRRVAALKLWADDDHEYATLYTATDVWKFSRPRWAKNGYSVSGLIVADDMVRSPVPGSWEPRQGPRDDTWPIPNPMGRVPMVELKNQTLLDDDPLSDIDGVTAMQDAINLVWSYLLNALDYASIPQRVVLGTDVPMLPILDSNGQKVGERPLELDTLINEKILWIPGENASISQWPAGNLDAYSQVVERAIEHIAAQTRTPPHYLIGKVANLPLALDTIVPIPGGRTTMGDLSVGDDVYAVDGSVQKVVGVSPIFYDHDCYRLTFDDGTEIVADAVHKWETTHFVNPSNPYGPAGRETSVVTTEQIAASLKTSMGTNNHYIHVAKPHDGPEADYVIDPYVLGVYLGDGDRIHGLITSHVEDVEEMAENLRDAGELVDVRGYSAGDVIHKSCRLICIRHDRSRCPYGHERATGGKQDSARCVACASLRYRRNAYGEPMPPRSNSTFVRRLKDLGLWKNKHIPERYFHGSFKQRLALLQGIMDTDGTVNRAQGSVAITLHDEVLARDVHRLIQSLGHKVALRERAWKSSSLGSSGTCWRMTWGAPDPVFRLARKAELQRTQFGGGDGKSDLPFRRYIVSCEPVESVPVRCINVSSDAHLFCVTDAFIATHNSAEALTAAETGLVAKTGERIVYVDMAIRDIFALVSLVQGDDKKASACRGGKVMWADTQFRALAQKVDALLKMKQIGFPFRFLAEEYGLSPLDVERVMRMREVEAEMDPMNQLVNGKSEPGSPPTAAPGTDPHSGFYPE
jgi:hypothetical protein